MGKMMPVHHIGNEGIGFGLGGRSELVATVTKTRDGDGGSIVEDVVGMHHLLRDADFLRRHPYVTEVAAIVHIGATDFESFTLARAGIKGAADYIDLVAAKDSYALGLLRRYTPIVESQQEEE